MMYSVYTDGALNFSDNIAGCAYLIMSTTAFINSGMVTLNNLNTAMTAEAVAIALAAHKLITEQEVGKEDTVVFYTDSLSAVKHYMAYANNKDKIVGANKKIIDSTIIVRKLAEMCTVRFEKVRGHKDKLNPNTVVDRISKIAVRKDGDKKKK